MIFLIKRNQDNLVNLRVLKFSPMFSEMKIKNGLHVKKLADKGLPIAIFPSRGELILTCNPELCHRYINFIIDEPI